MSEEYIDVISLIHDEFGTERTVARTQTLAGRVYIDGRPWEGDKLSIPRRVIEGKVMMIEGPDRKWRVKVKRQDSNDK